MDFWSLVFVLFTLISIGAWIASSIKMVGADEVAVKCYFGELEMVICRSGLLFLPACPGIELIRIPTRQIQFSFEGNLEHKIWSADRQGLLIDISGDIRFPYNEIDSIALMIRSGVPFEACALQKWVEDEVVSGLRDIMSAFTLERAIGRSNIDDIRRLAQDFFLNTTGLFARSGICGNNPTNFTLGSGEVIVRVETINPTPEMQKAMEKPAIAKYSAKAAKETARQAAEEIGGQILGIVARQHGMSIEKLNAELKLHPEKRGLPISEGGFAETFVSAQDQVKRDRSPNLGEMRIGGVGGESLPDSLNYLSLGGGGGAGVMIGGGKRGNKQRDNRRGEDGPKKPYKEPEDMTPQEIEAEANDNDIESRYL